MATFPTMAGCETRCKAQMVAKKWVIAHAARNVSGQIVARFQRYMAPGANAGAGAGWKRHRTTSIELKGGRDGVPY